MAGSRRKNVSGLNVRIYLIALIIIIPLLSSCVTYPNIDQTVSVYKNLGDELIQDKRYEDAAGVYLEALKICDQCTQIFYNLALSYIYNGDYELADSILQKLLTEDPENLLVAELVAYNEYSNGDQSAALSAYEDILDLYPAHDEVRENVVQIAVELGEIQKALTGIAYFQENSAMTARLYFLLGEVEKQQENTDYWYSYISALELEGDFLPAYNALAAVIQTVQDEKAGEALYSKLLESSITTPDMYYILAEKLFSLASEQLSAESAVEDGDNNMWQTLLEKAVSQGLGFSDLQSFGFKDIPIEFKQFTVSLILGID